MDEPSAPPEKPSNPPKSGGIDIQGGDVRAGRDIVAGNVNVAGDSIAGQTVIVQQGFTAAQVQKLVLLVAGVVVGTAALFFIIGAITVGPVLAALDTPLPGGSSLEAAAEMGRKLAWLEALPPGAVFEEAFAEDEVSSYFRFVVAPALDISDGIGRFMDTPGEVALRGNLDNFWGLEMTAQVNLTTGTEPVVLDGVWVKVLPTPKGVRFGWIPVTFLTRNLSERLTGILLGGVSFTNIGMTAPQGQGVLEQQYLVVRGVAK